MKFTKKQQVMGACLAGAIWMGGSTAQAQYGDLIRTLEENRTITAEQAASLREKAPAYTVRPSSKVVKDLQIRGRIHAQFGYVDADNDEDSDDYTTFEMRRVRMGMRGTLFDNVRAQLEANLVPGSDLSMRTAFLQWREHKPAYIKVGYDKPHSSIDEQTSSSEILTIERSFINNTVAAPGPVTGLSLEGAFEMFDYGLGLYTDSNNRNSGGANYLYNAMAGITLDDFLGEGQRLRFQGVYLNSDDPEGKVGSKADEVITAGAAGGIGGFSLVGEYFLADKDDNDTKGWYVMPAYKFNDNFELVARFEQADADKARGLRAPSRYTRDVPSLKVRETKDDSGAVTSTFNPQAGDEYQSLYLGLNYYFSGHPHKLMLGVEVAELDNTDAGKLETTTFYTAWRMLF